MLITNCKWFYPEPVSGSHYLSLFRETSQKTESAELRDHIPLLLQERRSYEF